MVSMGGTNFLDSALHYVGLGSRTGNGRGVGASCRDRLPAYCFCRGQCCRPAPSRVLRLQALSRKGCKGAMRLMKTSSLCYCTLFDRQLRFLPGGNPPVTFITFLKPARCSRLQAIMLRYPLWQCTANGISRSTSGGETRKRSSGHQAAPLHDQLSIRLRGGRRGR